MNFIKLINILWLAPLKNSFFIFSFFIASSSSFSQSSIEETTSTKDPSNIGDGYTLENFFSAALAYNPRLKIASERFNIGTVQKNQINSQLLPQIRANANISENSRNTNTLRQTFDGNRYSVQLTQTLFDWQAFTARKRAYLREDIAEIEYYGELASLLTDVSEKYFNALEAQDSLASIASELNAIENQAQQIEQLYSLELAQITDLYQVQATLAQIQSQKIQTQSQLAQEYDALLAISGLNAQDLYVLDPSVDIPKIDENLHFWIDSAASHNHLIQSKKLAVKESTQAIAQEKGAFLPKVSLIIQRQDSDVGFDNRPLDRSENTFFGVDVSIPLYSGGGNLAKVREAKSMEIIAVSELKQAELEVNQLVRTAYLQAESSGVIIAAAQKLVESTSLSSTAMQRGFDLGTVTSVEVLSALRDQYRAERELQRVRYAYIKSMLLLKKEAGTLSSADLEEISGWLSPSRQN
ncbi:TolC family protein [Gammaproteobacteria bacterium]|nr:TolC family protein [Gammaproteobacteria bacterium]